MTRRELPQRRLTIATGALLGLIATSSLHRFSEDDPPPALVAAVALPIAITSPRRTATMNPSEPVHTATTTQLPVDQPLSEAMTTLTIDDRVERSSTSLRVELVDARGQPLDWDRIQDGAVQLRRKFGPYWVSEPAQLVPDRDAIESRGDGQGLEPGRYEVEASLGDYGRIQFEFSLETNQTRTMTRSMPGALGRIRLRYETPDGRPIPVIGHLPIVMAGVDEPFSSPRENAPEVVRHDRDVVANSCCYRGGRRSRQILYQDGPHREDRCYRTDDGSLDVWAVIHPNRPVVIHQPLATLFRNPDGTVEIKTRVLPGETGVIVLHPLEDYDQRIAGGDFADTKEPSDNGPTRASRFWTTDGDPDPFNLQDLDASLRARLLVDLPESFRVRVAEISRRDDDLVGLGRVLYDGGSQLQFSRGLHFVDLPRSGHFALFVGDGALLHRDATKFSVSPGAVTHITPGLGDLRRVRVELRVPRTLAARLEAFTITLLPRKRESWRQRWRPPVVRAMTRVADDRLVIDSFLDPDQVQWVREGADLHINYEGRNWSNVALEAEDQADILRGHLSLDLRWQGPDQHYSKLVVRAVDANGAGLPWVEASLIPIESDGLAQRVRRIAQCLRDDGVLPRFEIDPEQSFAIPKESCGGPSEFDLVYECSSAARRAFPEAAMLQRLRKHGAWYDTRNHACGDHHGYLTMSAQDIKPGQRYVLYLWSASRDDLEPDRRIVFEAQTGITDLGAIVLEPPR